MGLGKFIGAFSNLPEKALDAAIAVESLDNRINLASKQEQKLDLQDSLIANQEKESLEISIDNIRLSNTELNSVNLDAIKLQFKRRVQLSTKE